MAWSNRKSGVILGAMAALLLVGCLGTESETVIPPAPVNEPAEFTESAESQDAASDSANFYTVDHYDLEADPAEDLKATLARAQAENKTVLLQVGGDWCGWCKLMTSYIDETESVKDRMASHYLIQKVTFDQQNKNEDFLSQYPKISGYPHLFVLDSGGKLLHSQDTADLEEGKGYSESAFTAFLDKWKPGKPD